MLDEELKGTNVLIAETFDNNNHVFYLVNEDNSYYLKFENDLRLIKKIIIKPDLWIFFKDGGYEHGIKLLKPCHFSVEKVLVKKISVDPDIFELLVNNKMISYSTAMADLYELPSEVSSDYVYHKRDYKNRKNKDKVLSKMRKGIFN